MHDVTAWLTNTYCLHNIARSKVNQTVKFGKLIKCNKISFSFKNHAENETERLVPDLFSFLKKA